MRPVPEGARRWISRLRWLRWLDGLLAWLVLWGTAMLMLPSLASAQGLVLSLAVVGIGIMIRPLRVRWRPVTGPVGLAVSRRLRPGDRAWYVRGREADVVLVTARHGVRLVVARPNIAAEGISVRRTRNLMIPLE